MADAARKPRVLTGDRPTGRLHLGHLVGSLRERVALQDEHECFNIVADLHTLTTRPAAAQIRELPRNVREMVVDLLSAGIDPQRTVIYLQSGVPAVYDLAILLQMLIPTTRLQQLESVRDMAQAAHLGSQMSLGLLGYPVLQAADILMARAELVPVGGDNLAHVQIARELAARFNELYGDLFALPEGRASRVRSLPGVETPESRAHFEAVRSEAEAEGREGPDEGDIRGHKMSKSIGNAIWLRDDAATVERKLDGAAGETLRAFVDALIDDAGQREALVQAHAEGQADDVELRRAAAEAIEAALAPMRARRAELQEERGLVEEIVVDGTIRAREVAYETLQRVRELMGLEGLWAGLVAATEARAEARKKPY